MAAPSSAILRGAMQLGVNWLLRVKDGSTIVKPVSTIKFIGATVSQDGTDPYQANVDISGSFAGLRYASVQAFNNNTVGANTTQAPVNFSGAGGGTFYDPDGLFTPHANVATIPASWCVATGKCNVQVVIGTLFNATGMTSGAVTAQLWVFQSFGSSSHESIVAQPSMGYRDIVDVNAAGVNPSISATIMLPQLIAGNVIEFDFLNNLNVSATMNGGVFAGAAYGATYFNLFRISDG